LFTYDADRLTIVSGATSASFVYDGNRVRATMGGVTQTTSAPTSSGRRLAQFAKRQHQLDDQV